MTSEHVRGFRLVLEIRPFVVLEKADAPRPNLRRHAGVQQPPRVDARQFDSAVLRARPRGLEQERVRQDTVVLDHLVVSAELVEAAELGRVEGLEGVITLWADWRSSRIAEERRVNAVIRAQLVGSLHRIRKELALPHYFTHASQREQELAGGVLVVRRDRPFLVPLRIDGAEEVQMVPHYGATDFCSEIAQ